MSQGLDDQSKRMDGFVRHLIKRTGPLAIVWLITAVISWVPSRQAKAAACCARSPAAPFLILGEDLGQINFGVSGATQVKSADSFGRVASLGSGRSALIMNYRVDAAVLLSDQAQLGVSLPWVSRHAEAFGDSEQQISVGDLRVSLGYEFLPLWSYSKWKPQGFLFSVVNLPTGRSTYESVSPALVDVSGSGFVSLSFGTLFLKRWDWVDAFVIAEGHFSFPRTFSTSGFSYDVAPGFGGSAGGGLGYSPWGGRLRVGVRFQPRWDQLEQVEGRGRGLVGQGGSRWVTDSGIDLSVLIGESSTLMASYTDQTWFGPSQSAPLNRSFAMSFQHRWPR